jgi:hypothetical protein
MSVTCDRFQEPAKVPMWMRLQKVEFEEYVQPKEKPTKIMITGMLKCLNKQNFDRKRSESWTNLTLEVMKQGFSRRQPS